MIRKIWFIFITLLILPLLSCGRIEGPRVQFKEELGKASPDFREGWKHGCEVGSATGAGAFYRMFAKNNVADGWKMTSSPDYKTAWGWAFWYCYRKDHIGHAKTQYQEFFGGMI